MNIRVAGVKLVKTQRFLENRGCLSFGEVGKHLSFEIERWFIVDKIPEGAVRGNHAHRKSRQAHICSGVAKILLDDGDLKQEIVLDKTNMVLIVEPMVWNSFTMKEGSALFVFCSDPYDEKDYIRDYKEFKRLTA